MFLKVRFHFFFQTCHGLVFFYYYYFFNNSDRGSAPEGDAGDWTGNLPVTGRSLRSKDKCARRSSWETCVRVVVANNSLYCKVGNMCKNNIYSLNLPVIFQQELLTCCNLLHCDHTVIVAHQALSLSPFKYLIYSFLLIYCVINYSQIFWDSHNHA